MFGKSEITFKAQIKVGAHISQDHCYSLVWPDALHPRDPPVKFSSDLVFEAELRKNYIDLRRPGYGGKPNYGNGSIFVSSINDLIVAPEDRKRVIDYLVAKKKEEIEKAAAGLAKLHNEMAAIAVSRPNLESEAK